LLAELRLTDLIDILIVASLIWFVIAWFRTSQARLALMGLGALGALFGLARGLELQLTTSLLQGFFAVLAVMLVVVFQEDLRRLFEGIAVWGLRRGAPHPPPDVERALVRALFQLAQVKVGALVILPGREPLDRHLDGGIHLDGRFSEQLILSLFDPQTPGHDGGVLVNSNRVSRFGVHLPLSTDWDRLGGGGTRHAAALGLAERCDAMCLVVSEERGEVSIAQGGEIQGVATPEDLALALKRFIGRSTRPAGPSGLEDLLGRLRTGWREGVVALGLAASVWYVAVPGGAVETMERRVPVKVENLPEGFELVSVEPADVAIRLEGPRRDLYMAGSDDLFVRVDALLVQLGRRTFALELDQIESPEGIHALSVEPAKVKISVKRSSEPTES
jgi:DNA integrity scanning protein DisA with diadenylate cyclase activity